MQPGNGEAKARTVEPKPEMKQEEPSSKQGKLRTKENTEPKDKEVLFIPRVQTVSISGHLITQCITPTKIMMFSCVMDIVGITEAQEKTMTLNNDTLQNNTDTDYGDFLDVHDYNSTVPEYTVIDVYTHVTRMCIVWYSITLVLGVIGNGLVIWIAGFRIKTVNAVWFLNLAIADFITCISLPLRISEWALYWDIYYDHFLCKTGITILFINMLCSVYFMTVISIDRCVCIFWPVWTKLHRTPGLAAIIALLIWILSLLISIPYVVFNHAFEEVTECFPKYVDFLGTHAVKKRKVMFITKNISMFAFPFAIILLSYILLFFKLRKIRRSSKSRRPFQVITTVIVTFFVCWFPYNTWPLVKISNEYGRIDMVITEVATCLAYFSSCINPILYILFSRDFQKKFVKSIPSMLENVFNERSDIDVGVSDATTNIVYHGSSLL
ncbi:N-formyl peptide receptor 3-like [Dendropsophus ebraccatus]|uniref:N-formyl peptide receptor 3-like n=1 Tax=Dendropsophus ebraccatus TaxID=150705 RepID=UPI0038312AC0